MHDPDFEVKVRAQDPTDPDDVAPSYTVMAFGFNILITKIRLDDGTLQPYVSIIERDDGDGFTNPQPVAHDPDDLPVVQVLLNNAALYDNEGKGNLVTRSHGQPPKGRFVKVRVSEPGQQTRRAWHRVPAEKVPELEALLGTPSVGRS